MSTTATAPAVPAPARLTPAQAAAVAARGNVLVMAGAGTGKTHTLIKRCLACVREEGAALTELLVVTFTEAAAAEMRQRLRRALEAAALANPADTHCREQLALFEAAHMGTLHSFCLQLVRAHFYELGLDPDLAVLEAGEERLRGEETLEEAFQGHYAGETAFDLAVQTLIQSYGGGRDEKIRALVWRLHHYAQTRPDADGWLAAQIATLADPEPSRWQGWVLEAIADWRAEWLPRLEAERATNVKAAEILDCLRPLVPPFSRAAATETLLSIVAAGEVWPPRLKGVLEKPLKPLLADALFLAELAEVKSGRDPLAEDWAWSRGPIQTLLELTRNFSAQFARRKLADGVVDFHDLEQFALRLLWDFTTDQPTAIARRWRERLRFVFVDEYQDINAAQDKIIQALSRDGDAGNRFLVGDVKQSIYRFRLADPKIFRGYARNWRTGGGQVLALAENFRSREGLLNWVNALFEPLMREEFGGVNYDAEARLLFGAPAQREPLAAGPAVPPRVEVLLLRKATRTEAGAEPEGPDADGGALADLDGAEKEARLLARRLRALRTEGHPVWDETTKTFRAGDWRDMAVLLRAPGRKAEAYARAFDQAGIPLEVARGGFFQSLEIADLLNLLELLDNPLQDAPVIGVLRSPLAGFTVDELAQIRLVAPREHFWTVLNRSQLAAGSDLTPATRQKIAHFLTRHARWRQLSRQVPLGTCLATVLAETDYLTWLGTRPRGAQRQANVRRLLGLVEQFDQFQQQGLHRFIKFLAVQQEAEVEPEVPQVQAENAVRLMSIHQSKGLEFPVVALADLAKAFNTQDRRAEIIFDEIRGLCPRIRPPGAGRSYPSLPHWLAQAAQRREQAGEELRLLYVALTRARDTLVLTGSITEKKWEIHWTTPETLTPARILAAGSYADWIGLWFAGQTPGPVADAGTLPHLRWRLVEETELAGGESPPTPDRPPAPVAWDPATTARLQAMLDWQYPCQSATQVKAKTTVTALRRQVAEAAEDEALPLYPVRPGDRFRLGDGRTPLTAAETGTAHHLFIQHLDLTQTHHLSALTAEADRLTAAGVLTAVQRRCLDLPAVADFWTSATGREIRREAGLVERELAFTTRFSPAEMTALLGPVFPPGEAGELEGEFVVVQGVADLVVMQPAEIWLVDFKSDALAPAELPDKIRAYTPQLAVYGAALAKTFGRPVTRRWLHFLALNRTEAI